MRVDSPCFTLRIYLQGIKVRGRRMNVVITMAQSARSIVAPRVVLIQARSA